MFHTDQARRYWVVSLLGLLFMLLVIMTGIAVNQTYLRPTHADSGCQQPPAGFDPTASTVTNAQLEQYGLPPRPSQSQQTTEYAFWLNLVQHAQHRVCATGTKDGLAFSGTSAVTPLSQKTANVAHDGNRSGYMATDSGVGYVSGTWQVPCVQGDASGFHTATLEDLIQVGYPTTLLAVGTELTHTATPEGRYGTDQNQYFVYYAGGSQRTGATANPTDFPLRCGDDVSAQIMYDNSTSIPQWSAYIGDTTTNSSFSMTYTASGLADNAFWGEYTPAYPLYNFGTVAWSGNELANGSNQSDSKPIGQWSNSGVQMVNSSGGGLAHTSALDSTGAGFTDHWQNAN